MLHSDWFYLHFSDKPVINSVVISGLVSCHNSSMLYTSFLKRLQWDHADTDANTHTERPTHTLTPCAVILRSCKKKILVLIQQSIYLFILFLFYFYYYYYYYYLFYFFKMKKEKDYLFWFQICPVTHTGLHQSGHLINISIFRYIKLRLLIFWLPIFPMLHLDLQQAGQLININIFHWTALD